LFFRGGEKLAGRGEANPREGIRDPRTQAFFFRSYEELSQ